MRKNSQAMIEYLIIFCAVCLALVASNFLGRMRNDVFGKFFDKASGKIERMR
ncbi:MAG: hypothetical protein PHY94_03890 [Candidatus Omnitrophica bacterium]|nr:hypothetical protein [Candidatus Omnitrophota bacterium]